MKPLSLLFLSLAPFLSFVDAVHGAPAVGELGQHRRALAAAQALDSSWARRGVDSKRQANAGAGGTNNNGSGPPTAFTVPLASPTTSDPPASPTVTTPVPNAAQNTSTTTKPAQTPVTTTTPANPAAGSPTTTATPDAPTTTTTPDAPTTTTTPDAPTTTTTPDSPADTPTTTTTPPPVDTPTSTTTPPTTTNPPVTTTDPGINQVTTPTDTPTTTPTDAPTTTPTDTPTTTDPLLGGVTSLLGGVTSDLGNVVTQVTSDLGGVTSNLGGVTSGLGGATTDLSGLTTTATDVIPPTTAPDQPTTTTSPIDTGGVTGSPTDTGGTTDTGAVTPTTTATTSQILNVSDGIFPTTTDTNILTNPITTIADSTTQVSISIDSQYQFITASSFLLAPTATTTTLTATNTDPDAALTTVAIPSGGSAVTLTAGVIPSNIPMFITPPADDNPVPLGTSLDGYTQISILFQMTVNWVWVLDSPETAAQILAYIPPLIVASLNTGSDSLRTVGLKAFTPAQLTSANDLATMYVGQLKTDLVDDLAALIRAPDSAFYQTGGSVAQSIAHNVVMSFNIATLDGVSNEDGSANTGSSSSTKVDNSRRNAIIGVSVAFGLIALAVFVWWILKTWRARREGAHKRLSYGGAPNYGTAGAGVPAIRADSPPAIHNPFMTEREREEEARGIRRNSFYAIGPDDASLEEETFDYMSQRSSGLRREGSGGRGWGAQVANSSGRLSPNYGLAGHPYARKPVVGQPISQPILRESSMGNW